MVRGRRPDPAIEPLVANEGLVASPVKADSRRRRGPKARLYRACHEAILGHQVEGGAPSVGRRLPLPVNSIARGKRKWATHQIARSQCPSKSVLLLNQPPPHRKAGAVTAQLASRRSAPPHDPAIQTAARLPARYARI